MATMEQLEQALRKADAANDTKAAQRLATEIRMRRAAGTVSAPGKGSLAFGTAPPPPANGPWTRYQAQQVAPIPGKAGMFDDLIPQQPIEVELPDGSIAEFPAGTPDATMTAAIRKRFPSQAASGNDDIAAGQLMPWEIPDAAPAKQGESLELQKLRAIANARRRIAEGQGTAQPPATGGPWERYRPQGNPGDKSYMHQAFDMATAITPMGMARNLYDAVHDPQQAFQNVDDTMRLAANGISFGYADKAAGYLNGTGTDAERTRTDAAREAQGVRGMAAEVGGAFLPASAAFKAGATATRLPGMLGRWGGQALDGAGLGLLNAMGNDQDLTTGAGIGAGAGFLGQAVTGPLLGLARPITARLAPDKAARHVIVKALDEAGITPQQVGDDLTLAAADGQSSYALMDAMGHPGQRLASTVARSPGKGRTAMVEALETRQAGQGRRIAQALAEGFDAPDTAAQRIASLTNSRNSAADVNYSAARSGAGQVDVMPAVTTIDDMLYGGVKSATGIGSDSIEAALAYVRSKLVNADGSAQVIGFDEVLRLKQNLDDAIEKASRSGEGNRARMLGAIRSKLDDALEAASPNYAQARDSFRQGSKAIEAVDQGRTAATRGRFEDTIPAFNRMSDPEKSGFRAGYADPLIAQSQQAATGVNKARPLVTDATAQEFPAFAAPGKGDQLGRRLSREQTMFETRNAALGGSKTADNLADEASLSVIDPSVFGNLLTGNLWGAGRSALTQTMAVLKGQPANVRERLVNVLLQTGGPEVRSMLEGHMLSAKQSDAVRKAIVRALIVGTGTGSTQLQQR